MDTNYATIRIDFPKIQNQFYSTLIGKLLYVAVNSRSDVTAPIAILAQQMKDTHQVDWNELQRVCKYLKITKRYRLKLNDQTLHDQQLLSYPNANWAEDRTSCKSNSGFLFKLFGGVVSWASKEQ